MAAIPAEYMDLLQQKPSVRPSGHDHAERNAAGYAGMV